MTVTIDVSERAAERIRELAGKHGVSVSDYVAKLVESIASNSIDEIMAPFRKQVEDSGMTDEELDTFFEQVISEVRAEKRAASNG